MDIQLFTRSNADMAYAYPGVETMEIAVMGCVVNGPGESKSANIVSVYGYRWNTGSAGYEDGEKQSLLKATELLKNFRK